jgi:glycosyltransferase involved in cell wall biosynthesis
VNLGISDTVSPAREPIRALQVIDALGMGGAETWLMELLRYWSNSGTVQMDFLLTSGNSGIFDEEARRLGAKLHYVKYGQSNIAGFARRFRRILGGGRYDAIHDHQNYASGWHFLMSWGVLPRVRVTHVHNSWSHMKANYAVGLRRNLVGLTGKHLVQMLATHVCATSREALDESGFIATQRHGPDVSVVHCGIAVDDFNASVEQDRESVRQEFQWAPDAKIVLFVGRLDRALDIEHPKNHKNSWLAVNIVRSAITSDLSVRLLMAGAGDEARRDIERHIAQWGLADKLRLIGVRRDVGRLMRAADILLFPSRQEGLGMVAVEAQAAGLPVLASDAIPRECIVVPQLYRVLSLAMPIDCWAAALLEAMNKPRPPLQECRAALENSAFSIAASARRLEEIYSTALG